MSKDNLGSFLAEYDAAPDAKKALVLSKWIELDPMALFADLREHRPILQVPGGPVMLTLFDDVTEALDHNQQFTVRPYAPKMDPSVGPFMLGRDGTVYNQRDKGIMWALIQAVDMPEVRASVASLAAEAVASGASPDGRLDVVTQVSRSVPVALTGRYFGFPGPNPETMLQWSYWTQYDMFHNLGNDPAVHAKNVEAGAQMLAYLKEFLPQRAGEIAHDASADDIVARLLRLQTPASIGFDSSRMMTNIMGLLVGGVETTSAAVVQGLDQLIARPDALAQALGAAQSGDHAAFDAIFWEALRFNPINPFVVRLLVEPYTLAAGTEREAKLEAGSVVLISTASAMHDARQLPAPEAFDPKRPAYHYFHLGYGAHRCLGDAVSLQQTPEIARQILLAGFTKRAQGPDGQIDMAGGPFPEHFVLTQ